ncbi:alpha/beta fold hydrolase [Acidovorax carolinensis]|uniref:alpha/beta fold hydrolase n=1 Tax=Acidovorax carolinensis TaxID=553814 RepID=UPI001F44C458|nr:alpha/beta fold hydrolase [Acidovorax carolinensis]
MAYWEWNGTGNPAHPHVVVCVHGLTRQGRDFDTLARALSRHARVICPDVVGRGQSDWLADPAGYQIPQYVADMLALLGQLQQQAPVQTLDWVGTSMGGLIGMALCGQPGLGVPDEPSASAETSVTAVGSLWPLAVPVRRLVLNDVGPAIEWLALQRIGQYLGRRCALIRCSRRPMPCGSFHRALARTPPSSGWNCRVPWCGPCRVAAWRCITTPPSRRPFGP